MVHQNNKRANGDQNDKKTRLINQFHVKQNAKARRSNYGQDGAIAPQIDDGFDKDEDLQELHFINLQEDARNFNLVASQEHQERFMPNGNDVQMGQSDPYHDINRHKLNEGKNRRNPYINYSDHSIPNIIEMSKFSRGQDEESGAPLPITETNRKLGLRSSTEGGEGESSSAIYDQDQFVNEMSASKIFETANLGNQKYFLQLIAQVKQSQNDYLEKFQTQLENIQQNQSPLRNASQQQRPSVNAGAASAVNVQNAFPDSIIQISQQDFMQLMSLKNRIESNLMTHERLQQQFMTQYQIDVKVQLQQLIGKVQKYKKLCKKHYYRADTYKTKHLEHEFEMRKRIDQLESAMDRINMQANKNEELRYQKQRMAKRYGERMDKIENIIEKILSNDGKAKPIQKDELFEINEQRLHNSLGRISKFNNIEQQKFIPSTFKNQNRHKQNNTKNQIHHDQNSAFQMIQNKLNKSYDEYTINQRRENQDIFNQNNQNQMMGPAPENLEKPEDSRNLMIQQNSFHKGSADSKQNLQASRDRKKAIVEGEIKKLNDLIAQFRREDKNFMMNDEQKSSNITSNSADVQERQDIKRNTGNGRQVNGSNSRNEDDSELISDSRNIMNQAFVINNDDDNVQDEPHINYNEDNKGSPIFNINAFNDTSGFFNNDVDDNQIFPDDLNFNPPPTGPEGIINDNSNEPGQFMVQHGQIDQLDENQTIDLNDVSFSKELDDPNIFQQNDQHSNNLINSIEKTNDMIKMYNNPNQVNSSALPSPLNEALFLPNSQAPYGKGRGKSKNGQKKSEQANSGNNSINFSNIFNQMNESNIFGNGENQDQNPNLMTDNSILKQGSFSIDPQAAPYRKSQNLYKASPGFSDQKRMKLGQDYHGGHPKNQKEQNDPILFKLKFNQEEKQMNKKDIDQIDLSSIILAVSDHDQQNSAQKYMAHTNIQDKTDFKAQQKLFDAKKNKTHQKNLFNTTMKISEINQISAIKSVNDKLEATAITPPGEPNEMILGGGGLSSANSKFRDELKFLNAALNDGQFKEQSVLAAGGEMYNINISKDDAESIINLLKDYFTLHLSNGREIRIPRLNLGLLPSNFPQQIQKEIAQKISDKKSNNQQYNQMSANINNFFKSNEQSAIDSKPMDQLFDEGFCQSYQSPNTNQLSAISAKVQNTSKSKNLDQASFQRMQQIQRNQQKQINKSSFQNTTTQEEPAEISGGENPSGETKSNQFNLQSAVEESKEGDQLMELIKINDDQPRRKLNEGSNQMQSHFAPKDLSLNESPIMSNNHIQQKFAYPSMLNNSGLNMEDYSIPPNYHQNDTYLENVNDSNENAIFIMDNTKHHNLSNIDSDNSLPQNGSRSRIVRQNVLPEMVQHQSPNRLDNFDSIQGLEGIVNLSGILPDNTEIENGQNFDAGSAPQLHSGGPNFQGQDISNTYDLNDRIDDNLNSFQNFNNSSNDMVDISENYSGLAGMAAGDRGTEIFPGFLDLTNQGLGLNLVEDDLNERQFDRFDSKSKSHAAKMRFAGHETTTATRKKLWGNDVQKNNLLMDNHLRDVTIRSDKPGENYKFTKYNAQKPFTKPKSGKQSVGRNRKAVKQQLTQKSNLNNNDKSYRSSYRQSQRNSQRNQNKTRSTIRHSGRSKNQNFRNTGQKDQEHQRTHMNAPQANTKADRISEDANHRDGHGHPHQPDNSAIYEFENVQQAIIGVGVGMAKKTAKIKPTSKLNSQTQSKRQKQSKSSLNQQFHENQKSPHKNAYKYDKNDALSKNLKGGYNSFKTQKVNNMISNVEHNQMVSDASMNISLKNQALNFQNDSMFNDQEYQQEAQEEIKQIYVIAQAGPHTGSQTAQQNSHLSIQERSNINISTRNQSNFAIGSSSVRSSQVSNKNAQQLQIAKVQSEGYRLNHNNQTVEAKESKQIKKYEKIQNLINQSKNKRLLEAKLKSSVAKEVGPHQQTYIMDQAKAPKTLSPKSRANEMKRTDANDGNEKLDLNTPIKNTANGNLQSSIVGKVVKKKKKIEKIQASTSMPPDGGTQQKLKIIDKIPPDNNDSADTGFHKVFKQNMIKLQKRMVQDSSQNMMQLSVPKTNERTSDVNAEQNEVYTNQANNIGPNGPAHNVEKNKLVSQLIRKKPKIRLASREPSKESQRSFKSQAAYMKKLRDSSSQNQSTQKREFNTEGGTYASSAGAATAFDSENYKINAAALDGNSNHQSAQNIQQIKKAMLINHLLLQQQQRLSNLPQEKNTPATPFTPAQNANILSSLQKNIGSQGSQGSKASKLTSRASNPQIQNLQNPFDEEQKMLSRNSSTGAPAGNEALAQQDSAISSIVNKKISASKIKGGKIVLKSNQIHLSKQQQPGIKEGANQAGNQPRAKSTRAAGTQNANAVNFINFKGMKFNFRAKVQGRSNDSRQQSEQADQSIQSMAGRSSLQPSIDPHNTNNVQQIGPTTIISGSSSLAARKSLNLKIQMKVKGDAQSSEGNYFQSRVYNHDASAHANTLLVAQSQMQYQQHHYINSQNRYQLSQDHQSIQQEHQPTGESLGLYQQYQTADHRNMPLGEIDSAGMIAEHQILLADDKQNQKADTIQNRHVPQQHNLQVSDQNSQSSQRARPQSMKVGTVSRINQQGKTEGNKALEKNRTTLKVNPLNLKVNKNLQNKRLATLQKENSQLSQQSQQQDQNKFKKIPQKNR